MAVYLGTPKNTMLLSLDGYLLQDSDGLFLTTSSAESLLGGKLKIILNGVVYRVKINLPAKESE